MGCTLRSKRTTAFVLLMMLAMSIPGLRAEESQSLPQEARDHVYPTALNPAEIIVRHARAHQKAGRGYQALRLYFQAIEKLGQIKTDNPYIKKACEDLAADIQTYIGQIKADVAKKGLILYRGKLYTFEGLQKALKLEADRRERYERYLRWEDQQRRIRQDNQWQQEQHRLQEEQRLREDFRFQQEQRRQNEERRRNYEMQTQRQRAMDQRQQ